jgi:phenylacetate-CoA ligase
MKILESVRKISFWVIDFLKGSPVRKHYNDIKYILENFQSEKSKNRRDDYLSEILMHAVNTTPFYENIEVNIGLQNFPIINKGIIRDNYDDFKSLSYKELKNIPVVTSGSTGTPFKLFHNKNKRARNTADIIYFAQKGGFKIGSRLIYMKVWNAINTKSPLKLWMENIVPYSIFNYSNNDIANLISRLKKDQSQKGIVCFASTCDVIVNYLESINSEPIEANIRSIIANSDALTNYTKDKMEFYFKVPTLSRYSSMECGMVAQQDFKGGYDFKINWASFYVELLDLDQDVPVKSGKIGRVVITDLFNYCMPLIRYDTGDLAFWNTSETEIPSLERIEGRKVDLIRDSKGAVITSHIVTVNMWKYSELKQYQFAQIAEKEYKFKLNPWKNFNREEELINEFKGYLGKEANIKIEYVDEVPLLSSGKRRLVVNEME